MKTMRVMTLQDHVYEGKLRKVGDIYEAKQDDIPMLITRRRVQIEQPAAKRTYRRRDMKAED